MAAKKTVKVKPEVIDTNVYMNGQTNSVTQIEKVGEHKIKLYVKVDTSYRYQSKAQAYVLTPNLEWSLINSISFNEMTSPDNFKIVNAKKSIITYVKHDMDKLRNTILAVIN